MASLIGDSATSNSRVLWEPVPFHNKMLDGCWRPRSRDPRAELPELVSAFDGEHGPVVRLLLSAAGWATRPNEIVVAGRPVSVGYIAEQPPSVLRAIRADGVVETLLVVHEKAGTEVA